MALAIFSRVSSMTRAGELVVHQRTSVPICSPLSARRMFPGIIRSKTRIGRSLSLQKVMAVRSMTRRSG